MTRCRKYDDQIGTEESFSLIVAPRSGTEFFVWRRAKRRSYQRRGAPPNCTGDAALRNVFYILLIIHKNDTCTS
jgi:hypothetical protein